MKGAFIYVDAGKGHYVPAKALYDIFIEKGHEATLENMFLMIGSEKWNKKVKNSWRHQLHYPKVERIENTILDGSPSFYLIRFLAKMAKKNQRIFKEWYEKERPDFIFCTNYLAAPVMTTMLRKNNIKVPLFVVGTDVFDNQKVGVSNLIDIQYMPSDLGVKNYIKHGFDPSVVKYSPFPLKAGMEKYSNYSKTQAREELKMEVDIPTLLLNLGGEGIGNTKFLKALVKKKKNWQVIVLGNMSCDTQRKFDKFRKNNPDFLLITPGFVNNIGLYIKACDLQLGKTGGNAFLESLYLKRPFFISELLYSSRSYLEFMKEYKVGWGANGISEQIRIIDEYVNDESKKIEMEKVMDSLPLSFDTNFFVDMIIEDYRSMDTEDKLLARRERIKESVRKNRHSKNR